MAVLDVDAGAGVDHAFADDQIVVLSLGEIDDGVIQAALQLGELLVAANVEVFAEFVLGTLEVALLADQIALDLPRSESLMTAESREVCPRPV